MPQVPETHKDIIAKSQVVVLGTTGASGEPQVTALWFHFEDDILRMSINDNRQKAKNLRRDSRASAFFIDPENPYRTLELRGTVTVEPDPDYVFASKVGEKYGGVDMRQMDKPGEVRSVFTLNVEKVHAFGD